jgi:adenylate cyclase
MSAETAGGIVFTDIVGFTELTDIHGDELAVELLTLQDRLVNQLLPEGARIVKEMGDGLLLWFDDAREAVETSLTLQECFSRETTNGVPLWVRMGIHWGTPRQRGDDIIGRDVNLASRIADLAGPGEVLCSDEVAATAQADGPLTDVCFEPLGPVFVKGIAEPVSLLRAVRAASSAG